MSEDRRLTKNEKRRQKKKQIEVQNGGNGIGNGKIINGSRGAIGKEIRQNGTLSYVKDDIDHDILEVQVEYISADMEGEFDFSDDRQILDQFKSIFEKFAKPEELLSVALVSADANSDSLEGNEGDKDKEEENMEEENKISKKKKKLMSRLSVAELKQLVQRPDVVEAHDVTSSDPRLLVFLKAYRNTVPVPRHWCHKRKYLQGKRGIEKAAFQLPEFIADTGIAKIRASVMEQESMKKSKQKARDKVQPRMGKIDIDYQVLHDAFFKYQVKPKMIGHGDLYYEGREFEVDMKDKKAGEFSGDLLTALGMADRNSAPPPWLINMQRYGPPPSYPSMRISGLNAPIPTGAVFGYQPGGWGMPPVDEYGRPLYGDVFGVGKEEDTEVVVDRTTRWGELEEIEEKEEEGEEEDEEEYDADGLETPMTLDGVSTIAGTETPDTIVDLRKRAGLETPDSFTSSRELYQVLQEKQVQGATGQMFGSDRTYVLPGKGDVQISMNPDDLEEQLKDKDKLREEYDAQTALEGTEFEDKEDGGLKKKRRVDANSVAAKRYKDFKF